MKTPQPLLKRIKPDEIERLIKPPVDSETLDGAQAIVDAVRDGGEQALRRYAERFGERAADQPLVLGRDAMLGALEMLDAQDRAALEGAAERIERFALAQRGAISEVRVPIPGGEAGHTIEPVGTAGCYAPSGRYPLPSSVLMTATTARAAGCPRVVVASPSADPIMLAAAAIGGADEYLAVGGAHAIGALAYGFEGFDRCDVIAGPGNRWVTAAKQAVYGAVGIDMLAGPSELLVIADGSADAELIAADLLAQAEHDTDAVPMCVTTCAALAGRIEDAIGRQLDRLPTAEVARVALCNGWVCVVDCIDAAIELTDRVAPEHLEIMTEDAASISARVRNAGAVFIGSRTAEVFGDYGAGPNHTLPTGGAARFSGGLSVFDFIRVRAWISIEDVGAATPLIEQSERLAQMEGLHAHREAASKRRSSAAI